MIADIGGYVEVNGRSVDQKPAHDTMLNSEVELQLDEKVVTG